MTIPADVTSRPRRGAIGDPAVLLPAVLHSPELAPATASTGHPPRRFAPIVAVSAPPASPHRGAGSAERRLDEVEAIARIGSYSLHVPSGRWVSSKGLDAILGIDGAFDRSIERWISLVHPTDREAVRGHLVVDVLGGGHPFDRRYRIVRADTGEERWVHGRGTLELDGFGRPQRLLGTIADITELHRSEDRDDELVRERIRDALADGGLRPVFQPVVALASGEVIGYEALTQFANGTPPDQLINEAHGVGLGIELETACLTAALGATEALPAGTWLSLNVSPALILREGTLSGLLAGRSRRIVLEITEHAEVNDYDAVRRAIAGLGPTVGLAVDDVGAGFASLRHVIELRPRFVKLDMSLIRHVDRDLTRQAMVAGMRQFAARADCEVIAEGIEEPGELEVLREIQLSLGQGFLLGRPKAAASSTTPN